MSTASNKVRIYELAKVLGVPNSDVIDALKTHFDIEAKSSASTVDGDLAKKIAIKLKGEPKAKADTQKGRAVSEGEPKAKASTKTTEKAPAKAESKTTETKAAAEKEPAKKAGSKTSETKATAEEAPVKKEENKTTETKATVKKAPEAPAETPAPQKTEPVKAAPKAEDSPPASKAPATEPISRQPEPVAVEVAAERSQSAVAVAEAPAAAKPKKARKGEDDETEVEPEIVEIKEAIPLMDLAKLLSKRETELISHLFMKGIMVTINQTIQVEDAIQIAEEFGFVALGPDKEATFTEGTPTLEVKAVKGKNHKTRAPVVSIMGHVDHGKTTLLDAIRETRHKIVDTEAGGITQKIGAYTVYKDDKKIVFVDTPGHEAFTSMRIRGAKSTDIAIIVVAADDGVMPQTIEAINHARMANVPIIIAVNKIDKAAADPERVLAELGEHGVMVEKWGGDTISVEISALQNIGLDDLLENILVISELQELKADSTLEGEGVVLEAWLDKGKGAVATVLVQSGTLKIGDSILVGSKGGRVRALISDSGERLKEAGPSTPVEILGLNAVPESGEPFRAYHQEKEYKKAVQEATLAEKESKFTRSAIPGLYEGENIRKDFYVIVKADTHGSLEAITSSILQLATEEIPVHVIHAATGDVTDGDVLLATANNALIVCFNSGVENQASRSAQKNKILIKRFDVIYHLAEEIEKMMLGMLSPDEKEMQIGTVEVRQIFTAGNTTIAGSYVTDGKVIRNAIARVFRNNEQIYDGTIAQLKRFKEDAKEVAAGYECGITFQKFNQLEEGDIIKVFEIKEIERTSLT